MPTPTQPITMQCYSLSQNKARYIISKVDKCMENLWKQHMFYHTLQHCPLPKPSRSLRVSWNGMMIVGDKMGETSKRHLACLRYCRNQQIQTQLPDRHLHFENKPRTSRTRGSSTNHSTVICGMESQFKLFSITLRDRCLVVGLPSQEFRCDPRAILRTMLQTSVFQFFFPTSTRFSNSSWIWLSESSSFTPFFSLLLSPAWSTELLWAVD